MRHLSATMRAKTNLWMCVALAAGIVAAFLVVVLGTPTKRAEAAFPGNNGKIAFVSHEAHDWEIWTMKANGDNQTQLTNNPRMDFNPAFSPNGRKIAFVSHPSGTNTHADIFTMSANGTNKKRVARSESPDFTPAWSPDGTRIAFASQHHHGNVDIYVINQDGSGLTRLTTSQQVDWEPAWSPDGTRIAFRRDRKIYVMKAARESETNRPQRLTTSGSDVGEDGPAWSPDGTRIAFASNQTLYSIRADGSDQIRLTTTSTADDANPAWSPDGTKIAFERNRKISVMKAAPESETNSPKRLKGSGFIASDPDWQPLR